MQWNDKAIILSARKLGENAAIVRLITPEHGMYAGVDRGAFGKRKRGVYQPGNIVRANWKARLSEHMGMLDCELIEPVAAYILDDRRKLAVLTSAATLMEKILSDREKQPVVYAHAEQLVEALRDSDNWLAAYVRLELILLQQAGFGLDLRHCVSTGQVDDLTYVSPRSGCAVSRDAGRPYHHKMLILPSFLQAKDVSVPVDVLQILDGLRLCGYFLHERVLAPRGASLPAARARLTEMLQMEKPRLGEVAHA